jgi:hypothetical protein
MLAKQSFALCATLCLTKDRYDLFGCESFPGHLGLLSGPETNIQDWIKIKGKRQADY